jgi:hypothetical protein
MNNNIEEKNKDINNEKTYINGIDKNKKQEESYNYYNMNNMTKEEIYGYLFILSGSLLLLYTLNLLPVLKYGIIASSILLITWGAYKANIYHTIKSLIESYTQKK